MYFAVRVGNNPSAAGKKLGGIFKVRLICNSVTGGGIYPYAIVFARCEPFPTDIFVGNALMDSSLKELNPAFSGLSHVLLGVTGLNRMFCLAIESRKSGSLLAEFWNDFSKAIHHLQQAL